MSRPQAGVVPPAPRQKKGKTCPGSHKEWRPEAGPAAPCPPGSPTARIPSTFQAGSWEAEVGEEAASCPGASGRAEREGRHHPHPRRGHTWSLQAGRGAPGRRLAPASLGRLPAPPGGGRQMGRLPAQLRRQETATRAARKADASGEAGPKWPRPLRGGVRRRRGQDPVSRGMPAQPPADQGFLGQVTSLFYPPVSPPVKCVCLSQLFSYHCVTSGQFLGFLTQKMGQQRWAISTEIKLWEG